MNVCIGCGEFLQDDECVYIGDGGWRCELCGRVERRRARISMTLNECETELEELLEGIARGEKDNYLSVKADYLLEQWKLLRVMEIDKAPESTGWPKHF